MENLIIWICWHLPVRIVYWCVARAVGYATTGKYGHTVLPEITACEVMERWHSGKMC